MLSVGDYVTFTCKNGHRFESGNLTRVCQENRSWSGEEPTCKRNHFVLIKIIVTIAYKLVLLIILTE